jgi:hypothetical protein
MRHSFKGVRIAGVSRQIRAPSEAAYQAEHYGVLRSWLPDDVAVLTECNMPLLPMKSTQASSSREKQHFSALRADTLILDGEQRFVLEYVATASDDELREQFERVVTYCHALKASEALVMHFTTVEPSDKYRFVYPPFAGEGDVRLQAVHIWHNSDYSKVKLYTREHPDGEWLVS